MTVITTTNADWDILADVRDTLADAEVSAGVAAFKHVVIGEDADDFATTATGTPAALVRLSGSEEADPADSADGHVVLLEIEVLVRTRKADARNAAAERIEDVGRLLNLAANALMADPTRGGNARAAIVDGKLRPATQIRRRRTIDTDEAFATGSLQLLCALPVTDAGR